MLMFGSSAEMVTEKVGIKVGATLTDIHTVKVHRLLPQPLAGSFSSDF